MIVRSSRNVHASLHVHAHVVSIFLVGPCFGVAHKSRIGKQQSQAAFTRLAVRKISKVRQRAEPLIIPWARAFFGVFWCYSCFEFIRNEERTLNIEPSLPAGPLAIGWIAASLAWRLPQPYFLIGFLAPLLLVPVQRHINHINAMVAPNHDENSRFSGWNGLAVAVGGIFLALMILGLTLKPVPHR